MNPLRAILKKKNHTETGMNFIEATQGQSVVCMAPMCLNALPTTSGHAPDEMVGDVLGARPRSGHH